MSSHGCEPDFFFENTPQARVSLRGKENGHNVTEFLSLSKQLGSLHKVRQTRISSNAEPFDCVESKGDDGFLRAVKSCNIQSGSIS
jgi:hypothetical protein